MPLYWLCYRHNNQISVVIEPGASLVHARLRSALDGLDEGDFTEGHELPGEADDWATAIAGGSGSAPASSSPWASVCCRRTVDISVQRPQRRAQGRRKGLPATTCQRTARASCYGVRSQFWPRGRDTLSARLEWRPSQSCPGRQTHET